MRVLLDTLSKERTVLLEQMSALLEYLDLLNANIHKNWKLPLMHCYHTFLCHLDGHLLKKHNELYSAQMVLIDPLAHGLLEKKDVCENLNVIDCISFHGNKLLPKYFTKYGNKRFTDYYDEVCKFSI